MYKIITRYSKEELYEALKQFTKTQMTGKEAPDEVRRTIWMCNATSILVFIILILQPVTPQTATASTIKSVCIPACTMSCIIGWYVLVRTAHPYLKERKRLEREAKTAREILELFYRFSKENWYAKILSEENNLCIMSLHQKPNESSASSQTFIVKGKRIERRSGTENAITADLNEEGLIIIITDTTSAVEDCCH